LLLLFLYHQKSAQNISQTPGPGLVLADLQ